jgi:hypothetical protein
MGLYPKVKTVVSKIVIIYLPCLLASIISRKIPAKFAKIGISLLIPWIL